ncbi:MAG: Hsp33 family molecular chaperone [Clostridia bacterium]|nr:Hsp33 family molecular chaperone [Clostridia bacterium]
MKDYLIRGASDDGALRFFACITTDLVEEARQIHDCYPVAAAALGRMLTVGSMMGTMLKSDGDILTLQINGKGPAKGIVVVSDNSGNVRGYINNPHVETMLKQSGKLDVGAAVGIDGNLTVIKDFGLKEPYVGQIPIVSGEIADDFTVYFANSEQTPSSVGLGVLVQPESHVSAAGGFIVQVMPEALDETIDKLEQNLIQVNLKSITSMINEGMNAEAIIGEVLKDIDFSIYEKKEIGYVCNCSRERVEKALISMGETEIRDIIETDEKAELACHFCSNKYHFNKEELINLLEQAKK